jgi:hypothetical protein
MAKHHPLKFYKRHWRWTVPLTIFFIAGSGVAGWAYKNSLKPEPAHIEQKIEIKPPQQTVYISPLSGRVVTKELSLRPVTGVMIENSVDARPQSGLYDADLVYESLAEGGITRFLSLYQESTPKEIGPVRSVRIHFANLIVGYDAPLAHVGGADQALSLIHANRDLDEMKNGASYWRSSERSAPHNAYTSFEKLDALNTEKGYIDSKFSGFERKDDSPVATPDATNIYIPISAALYDSRIKYQPETNSYLRFQGGEKHLDTNGKQINPKVVVVMKAKHGVVADDNNYKYPQVFGTGDIDVFQDGTITKGTWSKKDAKSSLTLLDSKNQPLKLNAGQTWITIIPDTNESVIEEPVKSD